MKSSKLVSNVLLIKAWQKSYYFNSDQCYSQCFGSGSGLNPDSIRSVDPGSESGSGYGSREGGEMTHKYRKS